MAVLLLVPTACSTARRADEAPPTSPGPDPNAATAVAPVQPPGMDGTAGIERHNACTAIDTSALGRALRTTVMAKPSVWNDAGVPSLDLCALVIANKGTVQIGVSALPAQPGALERLYRTLGPAPAEAAEIGSDGRFGPAGAAFRVADRVVRIGGQSLTRADAGAIASAVSPNITATVPPARITDSACQPSGALAEQFLGVSAQLRRDYRVRGALTCIWGTADRTVAIVESLSTAMPEARHVPKPALAPVGQQGFYLRDVGELVFRSGRRVVRVSALAEPPVVVPMERLLDIVDPIMPLFIR